LLFFAEMKQSTCHETPNEDEIFILKAKDTRKKRKNVKLCFPRRDLLGHQFETLARARRMGDIFFKDRQNIFIFFRS